MSSAKAAYWSTFAARLFGAGAWIAVGAAVAYTFGRETRGAIEDLYVLRLGLHAVASLGAPAAATFLVARDAAVARTLARTASAACLALGAVAAALLAALALGAPSLFRTIPTVWTLAFAASAPLILAAQVLPAILLGAGRPVAWNVVSATGRVVLLVGLALLAIPSLRRPETVVGAILAAEVASVALAAVLLRMPLSPRVDRPLLRRAAPYARSAWLHASLAFGFVRTDVLILASIAGTASAGLYAAAGLAREVLLFLPWIAGMLHMPRVAAATAPRPTGASGTRSPSPSPPAGRALGWGTVVVALTAALLLASFPETFVVLTASEKFRDAAPLVRILVPASLIAGAANVGLQELLGRGAPRAAWLAPGAALIVSVGGNLLFVPRYDAVATAWTALAASIVLAAITALGVRQARREAAASDPAPSTTGP